MQAGDGTNAKATSRAKRPAAPAYVLLDIMTEDARWSSWSAGALEEQGEAAILATVFLGHDLKHQRKVALKVLRPELATAIPWERFLREIQVAANLHHPHILALYDSGEASGFLCYVMPYMEGESS